MGLRSPEFLLLVRFCRSLRPLTAFLDRWNFPRWCASVGPFTQLPASRIAEISLAGVIPSDPSPVPWIAGISLAGVVCSAVGPFSYLCRAALDLHERLLLLGQWSLAVNVAEISIV